VTRPFVGNMKFNWIKQSMLMQVYNFSFLANRALLQQLLVQLRIKSDYDWYSTCSGEENHCLNIFQSNKQTK